MHRTRAPTSFLVQLYTTRHTQANDCFPHHSPARSSSSASASGRVLIPPNRSTKTSTNSNSNIYNVRHEWGRQWCTRARIGHAQVASPFLAIVPLRLFRASHSTSGFLFPMMALSFFVCIATLLSNARCFSASFCAAAFCATGFRLQSGGHTAHAGEWTGQTAAGTRRRTLT